MIEYKNLRISFVITVAPLQNLKNF